jgi:hypothetical protein
MQNDDFSQPPTRVDDAATRRRLSGPGRVAATFLLALGLTAVGGVAIVNAASPDPSASATPAQTSGTSGGSTTTPSGDCPNM